MPSHPARPQYSPQDENQYRDEVARDLARCVKKDEELQPVRLVLQDTVTGTRYVVTIASGAVTLTAIV